MKKIVIICFSIMLSGLLLVSCGPKDQVLQKEIETVLSSAYKGISTTVKDGVVNLEGVVDSEEAKIAIEQAAKSIKGIKSIANNITVKLPEPPVVINPDDAINTAISSSLTTAGFKDVKVAVSNGEVTLSGDIKKADLAKVMQIANESSPKKIHNTLNLK